MGPAGSRYRGLRESLTRNGAVRIVALAEFWFRVQAAFVGGDKKECGANLPCLSSAYGKVQKEGEVVASHISEDGNGVQSPCVGACCLDDVQVCLGCFRSRDEIVQWWESSDEEPAGDSGAGRGSSGEASA